MSQVIMGKGGWVNHKVFERGGKKQHKQMYLFFIVHVAESIT